MQKNTDRYRYFKYSNFSHSADFKIGKETTKNLDDSLNIKKPRLINNPTNTPRVFYIEKTWKRPFPHPFNLEYT